MSNARPLVSVITPTYNGARYLAETIDSALAQDYPNLEIIIAVDGSTDETGRLLEAYRGDRRVKALELPHRGENVARNAAIRASRGEYIALLDHDDLWLPGKLSRQIPAIEANPAAGLCHSAWERFGAESRPHVHRDSRAYHGRCFDRQFQRNGVGALTAVLRRSALPPHLFHEDIQIAADYALWLDVLFYHEAIYIPEILARHRVHPGQITWGRRERWKFYEAVSRIRLLERVRDELPPERYDELRAWTIEQLRESTYERRSAGDAGWAALGFYLLRKYGCPAPFRDAAATWLRSQIDRLRGKDATERRYLQRPA